MSNQDDTWSAATLTLSSAVRYPCLSHHGSSGDRSRKLRQSHEGEPARSVMSMSGRVRRNVAKSTFGAGRAPLSSDAHTGIQPKLIDTALAPPSTDPQKVRCRPTRPRLPPAACGIAAKCIGCRCCAATICCSPRYEQPKEPMRLLLHGCAPTQSKASDQSVMSPSYTRYWPSDSNLPRTSCTATA